MFRASRVVLVAGILAVLAGCAAVMPQPRVRRSPLQAHVAYDNYPAQIPFKRTAGDLPIVLAQTDRAKFWMLVDTGCDAVVFTPETAKRAAMKITPVDAYTHDFAGTANRIDGITPIDQLSIGPTHYSGFYSVVNDIGNLTDKDHPPSAVAGLPMFGDALLTFDYAHNRLIVEPGALPPPDGNEILPMVVNNGKATVPFGFGDRTVWLILDTGFSGFIVIPRSQVPSFPGAEVKLARGTVKCFYTTGNVDVAQLRDDLRIGRHTIQQPIVAVGDGGYAMIGAQYLKHFVVTIDQRNHRIRFASPDKRPIFLPAVGREAEHEISMLDRLMARPSTGPAEGPASQPAADAGELDR